MTQTCTSCGHQIDRRTLTAGGTVCFDCATTTKPDDRPTDPLFPTLYSMAPIGVGGALEAIEGFHFCSNDCRSTFRRKTSVALYAGPGCTEWREGDETLSVDDCVCEECGTPLEAAK